IIVCEPCRDRKRAKKLMMAMAITGIMDEGFMKYVNVTLTPNPTAGAVNAHGHKMNRRNRP
ncbi:hypothetical protein WP50_15575, partial [Lactiplantibacillus plantarum]